VPTPFGGHVESYAKFIDFVAVTKSLRLIREQL
jgi:hypothetical protein